MNISPSLHSETALDFNIKAPLARDVLNLCGVQVPSVKKFVFLLLYDSAGNFYAIRQKSFGFISVIEYQINLQNFPEFQSFKFLFNYSEKESPLVINYGVKPHDRHKTVHDLEKERFHVEYYNKNRVRRLIFLIIQVIYIYMYSYISWHFNFLFVNFSAFIPFCLEIFFFL